MSKLTIIFILMGTLVIGCQKSYYTYDYNSTTMNSPENKYPITAQMVYRGLKKSNQNKSVAISFEFLIENMGDKQVTLTPESYYIVDENSKQLDALVKNENKQIVLSPDTFSKFSIYYPLTPDYNLEKTKSFQIVWNYKLEDHKYELMTKFDKRRLKRELDSYGYPYSARFVNGPAHYRRMGYAHSPLWRYQNLENSNFRKRK